VKLLKTQMNRVLANDGTKYALPKVPALLGNLLILEPRFRQTSQPRDFAICDDTRCDSAMVVHEGLIPDAVGNELESAT